MISANGIASEIQLSNACVWSMPPNGIERVKNARNRYSPAAPAQTPNAPRAANFAYGFSFSSAIFTRYLRRSMSNLQFSICNLQLNVQVAHELRVRLDERPARLDLVAHQRLEDLVRQDRVFHGDPQQRASLRIHRRRPELRRVHFA